MNEEVQVKPRYSMSEEAFRKYEEIIGYATKGTYDVDPLHLPKPLKQSTLAVNIREAIRGWKKFGYVSKVIPIGYEMGRIKVLELTNGKVRLQNEYADKVMRVDKRVELKSIIVDSGGMIVQFNQKEEVPQESRRWMHEVEPLELQKWCEELKANPTWRINIAWLIKANGPEDVEFLTNIKRQYEGLDVEELDHGWWRLYQ